MILPKGCRTAFCLFSQGPGKTNNNNKKRNISFVFLQSSVFFLYSHSCATKRRSRSIPFPEERRKPQSFTYFFHLWSFYSLINGESCPKQLILQQEQSPGSTALGPNKACSPHRPSHPNLLLWSKRGCSGKFEACKGCWTFCTLLPVLLICPHPVLLPPLMKIILLLP